MRIKSPIALFLAFFVAAQAQVFVETWCRNLCSDGAICGKGKGESEEQANENANKEIAKGISSSIGSISTDILSVEEKDGSLDELRSYVQSTIVESSLENMEATKLRRSYMENGVFAAERYICNSAAAKPYLNEMRHLKDSLKFFVQKINKETCGGLLGVYNKIRIYEGIAENLGQMDRQLKKEYDAFYGKMKNECGQLGRGVYINSNLGYFEDKMASVLARNGCAIAEENEDANLRLDLDAQDCDVKTDKLTNAVHCYACVKVNLFSNKTGKSAYKDNFKEKGSWTDRETACEKAYENAVPKLWEKIERKIQKEGCK